MKRSSGIKDFTSELKNGNSDAVFMKNSKDRPVVLQKLIDWDKELTQKWSLYANANDPQIKKVRLQMKALEISGHGVPCLALNILLIWYSTDPWYLQFLTNVFIAILLDCFCVALVKALVRRKRPSNNHGDMIGTVLIDHFSFPSGHASRVVLLMFVFLIQGDFNFVFDAFAIGWAVAVCASRVLLGRHHVCDVVGGILLGIVEFLFMSLIWLSASSSLSLLAFFKQFESFHMSDE